MQWFLFCPSIKVPLKSGSICDRNNKLWSSIPSDRQQQMTGIYSIYLSINLSINPCEKTCRITNTLTAPSTTFCKA